MIDWHRLSVSPAASIRETMEVINLGREQIAFVVNASGVLLGTVTDGDIRRSLLRGIGIEACVTAAMNPTPVLAIDGEKRGKELLDVLRSRKIRHLPVVDRDRRLIRIDTVASIVAERQRDNLVVLMAGGRGRRLYPLTEDVPKALIAVGERPILETILTRFVSEGFHRFRLSVNYKAEMIEAHFGDGSNWNVSIDYLREDRQLGTAGALSLLDETPNEAIIVMNCDVLTKVRFSQLLEFHAEHGALGTMAVRDVDFQVPYGVVRLDGNFITGIDEKPTQRLFVNAGIYVLEPEALELLPKGQPFDMPQLFQAMMGAGRRCAAFPVCEYWIDVGQIADLQRAKGDFSGVFRDS